MGALQPQFDLLEPTVLLTIAEVELRSKMGRSWIYELVKRREFPAPIHMGGSKWIAAEVEEFIRRRIEERDCKHGQNSFVPRAQVLHFPQTGTQGTPLSVAAAVNSAAATESTLRVLGPELCAALWTLKIDIPELYLDPDAWRVNLLVLKIDLKPTPSPRENSKRSSAR